jgi:tetraacyldisaccharide 4'-kinase
VPRAVAADDAPAVVGDEPLLLAQRSGCPVWIGRERAAAARGLLAAHPECDVLIADDGLQHYALERNVEIVVMDRRGIGNGWLLPAGPLREGPERLDSVDALVVNGTCMPQTALRVEPRRRFTMRLAGERFHRLADAQQTCGATALRGRRLYALAGIGEPQRFFDHLSELGLEFTARPFPDHHRYTPRDLDFAAGGTLLMTEKDGVKCRGFAPPDTWVLRVDATVAADPAAAGRRDLVEIVAERIDGRAPA